jgi:hypothetical protein
MLMERRDLSSTDTYPLLSTVDDGSKVIAVHHVFRQADATSPRRNCTSPARQSRKGKERQLDDVACGIPEEYRLPPPPPILSSSRRAPTKRHSTKTVNVSDCFHIGDVVSVVGRVDLWVDRKERILLADRVVQQVGDARLGKADHEGYIELIEDPNKEPEHLLRALLLSATEYSTAFEPPEARRKEDLTGMSLLHKDSHLQDRFIRKIRESHPLTVANEPKRKLRVMKDIPDDRVAPPDMRSLTNTRRLSSITNATNIEKIERSRTDATKKGKEEGEGEGNLQRSRLSYCTPSSQVSKPATKIEDTPERPRQLRSYTKLSDSKMTESTFRVYVEKHLLDYCSREAARCHTSAVDVPEESKSTCNTYRKEKRKDHPSMSTDALCGPPAFTLKYLQRVTLLREHARRTVEVATRRRDEKRRRLERQSVPSATKINKVLGSSVEKVEDKMERLYISVLRAMLMDGIIVLALPSERVRRPFDGKRACSGGTSDAYPHLDWIGVPTAAGNSYSSSSSSSSSPATDVEHRYRTAYAQEDAYQVITPSLLATPLRELVQQSLTHQSSLQLRHRLQAMDERWKYVRQESIQEGLQVLHDKVLANCE